MVWQKEISLGPFKRGFHLITSIIEKELTDLPQQGLLHLFLKHTSAALTINENAEPSVRADFLTFANRLVPENNQGFLHNDEGDDDMPAHIKSSIFGAGIAVPVKSARLDLGTWQGIYVCEFRNHGGIRKLMLTLLY